MAIHIPVSGDGVAGAGIDWSNAANWPVGGVPVSGGDVVLEKGKSYKFAAVSAAAVNLASLVALDCHLELPIAIDVNNSGRGLLARLRSGYITLTGATNLLSAEGAATVVNVVSGSNLSIQALAGAQVNAQAGGTYENVVADGGFSKVTIGTHATDRVKLKIGPDCTVDCSRKVEEALIVNGLLEMNGAVANITDGATGGVATLIGRKAVLRFKQTAALSHALVQGFAGKVDHSLALAIQTLTADIQTPLCEFIERGLAGTMVRSAPDRRGLVDVSMGLNGEI